MKTVMAIALVLLIGAGAGAAATRTAFRGQPGDVVLVPSAHVTCGVIKKPAHVMCFKTGLPRGSYSVAISGKKIEVVKNGKRSSLVFSAKQP